MTHENLFSIAIWLSSCLSFLCFHRETTSWYLVHTSALRNTRHQTLPLDEFEPSKPKRGRALGQDGFSKDTANVHPAQGHQANSCWRIWQRTRCLSHRTLVEFSSSVALQLHQCELEGICQKTKNVTAGCRVRSMGWEVQQPSSKPALPETQGKLGKAETHLPTTSIFSVVFSVSLQWIKIIPNTLGKEQHSVPPAARPFSTPVPCPALSSAQVASPFIWDEDLIALGPRQASSRSPPEQCDASSPSPNSRYRPAAPALESFRTWQLHLCNQEGSQNSKHGSWRILSSSRPRCDPAIFSPCPISPADQGSTHTACKEHLQRRWALSLKANSCFCESVNYRKSLCSPKRLCVMCNWVSTILNNSLTHIFLRCSKTF